MENKTPFIVHMEPFLTNILEHVITKIMWNVQEVAKATKDLFQNLIQNLRIMLLLTMMEVTIRLQNLTNITCHIMSMNNTIIALPMIRMDLHHTRSMVFPNTESMEFHLMTGMDPHMKGMVLHSTMMSIDPMEGTMNHTRFMKMRTSTMMDTLRMVFVIKSHPPLSMDLDLGSEQEKDLDWRFQVKNSEEMVKQIRVHSLITEEVVKEKNQEN